MMKVGRYREPTGPQAAAQPGSRGRVLLNRLGLLLIHPFRDGNGRLARRLADIMAAQAGYPTPAYGFSRRGSQKRRAEYLRAVQQGYIENYLPLARFFEEAILRRREAEG